MAVKFGRVVTIGNGFLVERAQNVGSPNLNIPIERIQETGNPNAVSVERDIPQLTFDVESLDATVDTEAMVVNVDPSTLVNGDIIKFTNAQPLDVVAPWIKEGNERFSEAGVIWPHLTMTSATWRFGVGTQGATQTFSFSGDAQYSANLTPYREEFAGAREVTDGVTTDTDNTVTSASAAFTAADVGAAVVGAGIPDGTTIASVTNATTVELSDPATASATGVTITITHAAVFEFANEAVETVEEGDDIFALGVCVYRADGGYKRLFNGIDYTSTATEVELLDTSVLTVGSTLAVCYFSEEPFEFTSAIHSTPSVKPGKVKGKNINLYIGIAPMRSFSATVTNGDATLTAAGGAFTAADVGAKLAGTGIPDGTTIASVTNSTTVEMSVNANATSTSVKSLHPRLIRWDGVQQVEINWRVTLDNDQELGNAHNVASDYDIPEVSGSVTLRPGSSAALFNKIEQVTGTEAGKVANLLSTTSLELQVRIENPRSGQVIKTFRVRDAVILPPGTSTRVGQKAEPQLSWSSDSGDLDIIKGTPLAA